MKIAHIIFELKNGGAENMLVDIINEQIKSNHLLSLIIINDNADLDKLERLDNNVNILKLNRKKGNKNPIFFLKLYFYLFKYSFDILHCHNLGIGKILYFLNTKKILTVHGINWDKNYLRYFTDIISISKAVKVDLQKSGFESTLIYNGVNSNLINNNKIYKKKEPFQIIQISRLIHETKGQDLLLIAIKELIKDFNLHLTFIGDGISKKYLEEFVKKNSLDKNVSFLGNYSREKIYDTLKDYDLLVQPSRHEGFGLTVVEGIFARIPILVSNIDGPFEIIKQGEYGHFFKKNDVNSLISSIRNIIEETDMQINIEIDKIYYYAKENFDVKKTATNYLNFYNLIKEK